MSLDPAAAPSPQPPHPPPSPPAVPARPAGRKHRRGLIAIIAAAVLLLAGMAWALSGSSTSTFNFQGSLVVTGDSHSVIVLPDRACGGTGGYSDLTADAQVVLTDDSGKTLALSQLGTGTAPAGFTCTLPFSFDKVPAGKKFYGIAVSHRGTIQFTEAQLRAGEATLTIGS